MSEINDRYSRVRELLGDSFNKLKTAKILVCGVGGVGGICADALARSGVGEVVIIDNDKFDITNQNRQIYSQNVGAVKVGEFARIYPNITAINELMTPEMIKNFDFAKFSVVIDAIDDMASKIALANAVSDNKFIASMGSAKRLDASQVKIASVWKSYNDNFAKKYRSELKRSGFKGDFSVVFSTEPARCKALGSFMGVTAVFGLNLASLAVRKILGEI